MTSLITWLYEAGIYRDVVAGVAVAISVASLAFLSRNTIVVLIKKLLPRLESKTPHINFEIKDYRTKDGGWESVATVSNAGNEPAYNLYVFYFEQFPDGRCKIKASDMENMITRPVLGIHDSLEFRTAGVRFEACNVTCLQEMWIEYENSSGVAFRVASIPPSPRGDIAKILPPRVIKRRLEQLPGASMEGSRRDAKRYKKGLKTLLPRPSGLSILRYNLVTRPLVRLKDWLNHASSGES